MRPRTPNYVTTESISIQKDKYDSKTLPSNSFVRPIEFQYVPQHCLDKYPGFDKVNQIFVYCRYGIVVVPKNSIREV